MTRICHGCHGPIDEDHKGYMSGASQCPLDHWEGCKGDLDPSQGDWRPCPSESDSGSELSENDNEKCKLDNISHLSGEEKDSSLKEINTEALQPGSASNLGADNLSEKIV